MFVKQCWTYAKDLVHPTCSNCSSHSTMTSKQANFKPRQLNQRCLVHPVLSFPTHCTGGALASSKPEQSKPLQVATRRSVSMHTYLVRHEKTLVFFSKKMGLQNGRTFLGQLRMMNFKEATMNFGSIVCHFSPPRPFGFVAHSWTQKHRESGRHGRVVMVGKLRWRTSHSKMCWKTKKIPAVLWKQSSMFTNSLLISLHFICSTSLQRVGQHDVCQCAKNHLMQQETQKPHEIPTLRTNSQKLIAKPCKGWTILPQIPRETSTATPPHLPRSMRIDSRCFVLGFSRTGPGQNLLIMAVLWGNMPMSLTLKQIAGNIDRNHIHWLKFCIFFVSLRISLFLVPCWEGW